VVKKAVVGTGAADKTQVAFMIQRLLPTAGPTTADAADALAVAIAHAHARRARSYAA
jgi:crossover junction endodeoxyribonuclease RuvC